jgi:hypothetical protein
MVTKMTAAAPGGTVLFVRAGGQALDDATRARFLRDGRAGQLPPRVTLDAIVFRQGDTPNRNHVRFRPGILRDFAASFRGVPFLRDHEQRDAGARAGTVLSSELISEAGGGVAIRQTLEVVKPWGVEAALDGTMDRFSVGWHNTAPAVCSACEAPYVTGIFGAYPGCSHMPGDEVEVSGVKRRAELLVTGAEGVETSSVSVPAVTGTGVEAIRAELSQARAMTLGLAAPSIAPPRPPPGPPPLTAQQLHVCRQLGITPEQYLAANAAPERHGLTAQELKVCQQLGITPAAFAKTKAETPARPGRR